MNYRSFIFFNSRVFVVIAGGEKDVHKNKMVTLYNNSNVKMCFKSQTYTFLLYSTQSTAMSKSFSGDSSRTYYGSPSYPSPLDRIRTGKRERAAQLGLKISRKDSYEVNQSFPKAQRKYKKDEISSPDVKKTLQDFKGI